MTNPVAMPGSGGTAVASGAAIRPLVRADAAPYHALRLRMLQAYPDAFTSSFEEDSRKSVSWSEARIVPGPDSVHDFVLGAFLPAGQIAGAVGLAV
ncbi:MAG: hypothetical protein ABI831_22640, partial [Betaproteobacteria bacterium]